MDPLNALLSLGPVWGPIAILAIGYLIPAIIPRLDGRPVIQGVLSKLAALFSRPTTPAPNANPVSPAPTPNAIAADHPILAKILARLEALGGVKPLLVLIAVCLLSASVAAAPVAESPRAVPQAVEAEAAKPVLLVFTGVNCRYCVQMDRQTWPAESVKAAANKYDVRRVYVGRSIDWDVLVRKYKVEGIPTVIVLHGEKVAGRKSGFIPSAEFAAWLRANDSP